MGMLGSKNYCEFRKNVVVLGYCHWVFDQIKGILFDDKDIPTSIIN